MLYVDIMHSSSFDARTMTVYRCDLIWHCKWCLTLGALLCASSPQAEHCTGESGQQAARGRRHHHAAAGEWEEEVTQQEGFRKNWAAQEEAGWGKSVPVLFTVSTYKYWGLDWLTWNHNCSVLYSVLYLRKLVTIDTLLGEVLMLLSLSILPSTSCSAVTCSV